MKPRVAIFSLTGCEGCSLAILELEEQLLDILSAVEVVNFREGMTERAWDIDIGLVDGAISTPHDEALARKFRESCQTLVAIGACACLGGVNTLKNTLAEAEYRAAVYGDSARFFPTTPARPLSAVVKVEAELPGCPLVKEEFLEFLRCALAGKRFALPDEAVCVECKRAGNLCLYERGEMCLGPITRGGCGAICPTYGSKCEACRGIVRPDALRAASLNFRETYPGAMEGVLSDLRLFGAHREASLP
ncbi:MAG: NADH:ubiquinone oxidoreductase [Phycisphaerae bacterium]